MRGTHWGQGYNRPTGCSAEKAPHAILYNIYKPPERPGTHFTGGWYQIVRYHIPESTHLHLLYLRPAQTLYRAFEWTEIFPSFHYIRHIFDLISTSSQFWTPMCCLKQVYQNCEDDSPATDNKFLN